MKKVLTAALITSVFFFSVLLIQQLPEIVPQIKTANEPTAFTVPESFHETGYYYTRLTQAEQVVYASIVLQIEEFPEEIEFTAISDEQIANVSKAVTLDHPMLYMFDGGVSRITRDKKNYLAPHYSCTKEEYEAVKKSVAAKTESILAQTPQGDVYETELYLHDYLIAHCQYDEEEVSPNKNNPAGVLIGGSAICSGYARTFKLLLDEAGVENVMITGNSAENGSEPIAHIWNAVRIDGAWYYVDVTWDDPIVDDESLADKYPSHNYFNVTDAMLSATHSDYTFDYPCDDESLFYYRVNNAYLTDENEDIVQFVADLTVTAAKNGHDFIDFKCATDSLYGKAIHQLFTKEKIYRAIDLANPELSRRFSNHTVHYSIDEANRRIIIIFSY